MRKLSGEDKAMGMSSKRTRFKHKGRFRKRALGVVVAVTAIGTSISAAHSLVVPMLIDETIEDRAAAVFTYQNQVSAALAETIVEAETYELPLLDALYMVEEQLNEACAPLQEAGRRHIEGEELGGLLQIAVYNALESCKSKSEEVAYYVRLASSYSARVHLDLRVRDRAQHRVLLDRVSQDLLAGAGTEGERMSPEPKPPIGFPLLPVPDADGRMLWPSLEQSVRGSIEVILRTRQREQLMRPRFGAGLADFIHAPNTLETRRRIRDTVNTMIERYEPRILLDRVEVTEVADAPSQLRVEIGYRLRRTGAASTIGVTLDLGA